MLSTSVSSLFSTHPWWECMWVYVYVYAHTHTHTEQMGYSVVNSRGRDEALGGLEECRWTEFRSGYVYKVHIEMCIFMPGGEMTSWINFFFL